KSSSTIIHHVESASNAENSPTFTNNIKSTSDTVILTNDVNSASNIENIDLNEFKKLHNNKQYRKAFKLINGYAKLDPKILFWMGYYHYKGYHESSPYKPDIMTSLKYLEAGAKLNDPDAQYYYSHIIFHCCLNGIENGYEIALKHLKKASEQNHPASMLEL
ncbi:8448_t:CDS:1, partial [Funneliformis caledonium]